MIFGSQAVADYCVGLHRRNSEFLGMLPKDRMRHYVDKGQVFIATEGGDLCGYIIFGLTPPWSRVWQACVEYDLRGLRHGSEMMERLKTVASSHGCIGITLRCRDGLEANWFWSALGFLLIRQVPGGKRRGKLLNVWAMRIASDLFWPETA